MTRTVKVRQKINDERIKLQTGKSLAEWSRILNTWGAPKKGHTATAKYLFEKYKIGPWWSQAVTVEYEYAHGLRSETHTIPADFLKALKANQKAQKIFDSLPPSHKKEYIEWIVEAKRPETRLAHIRKSISRLLQWKKEPR